MSRITFVFSLFAVVILTVFASQCRGPEEAIMSGPVNFDPAAAPYPNLSEYGFFTGSMEALQPNERVMPYDLVTPLFTDYAHKSRFVWMPDSVTATVDEDGEVQFPDNTVLIKNFYYPADFTRPADNWNIIETRILIRRSGKWEAFTYVWNEDQSDAELNIVGDLQPVDWIDEQGDVREIQYAVPNKNQCKSCHSDNNAVDPIGPKVRNLNRSYDYSDGTANQLERWHAAGILDAPDYAARFQPVADWEDPASGDLEDRALAYLDVNCGHCHRPEGPAHTSGLFLTVDHREEPVLLGLCKSPVAAGRGSGGRKFGVAPGYPDSSIVVYRMESTDPGVMMPELGRVTIHTEGIALVRDWIASLEGECE